MADRKARSKGGQTGKPRRPQRSSMVYGVLRACGFLLLMVTLAVAAIAGLVYVRVQHGPISLKPLAGLIEREINEELAGLVAQVEDAQIASTEGGRGIEMRLANLILATPSGETVASVPAASIELSGRALRSLRLVPSKIELIEPRLSLVYGDADGWSLTVEQRSRKFGARIGQASGTDNEGPASTGAATGGATASGGLADRQAGAPAGEASRIPISNFIKSAVGGQRKAADTVYLREIAVKNAQIAVDNRGALSEWRIVDGSIDLAHRDAARLASGEARIASSRGPWNLSFHADRGAGGAISLMATIRDLHPRVVGLAMPQLAVLQPLDLPVSGTFQADISADAKLSSARVGFEGSRGSLVIPSVSDAPLMIDKVALAARFGGGRLDLDVASLAWGKSIVSLKGVAQVDTQGRNWAFGIASERGQLAAEEFGIEPMELRVQAIQGRYLAGAGTKPDEVRFDRIALSAGGAELTGTGGVMSGSSSGGFFEAKLGATTVDRLKAIWPRGVASGARAWVGEKIQKGGIKTGTIKFYSGSYAHDAGVQRGSEPRRTSIALEAADVAGTPLSWLPPVEVPRLLVRLEDNLIEVNMPDASIALAPNRRIPLKGGRFAGSDLDKSTPQGEVTFRATAGVVPALEVLDLSPLRLLRNNGLTTDGIDGKADGNVKLSFPLISGLLARDVVIEAKAKLSDVRAKQIAGVFDAQGGTFAIDVSPTAVDASGEFLVQGVPVKLGWQRILEDNGEKQPPLRLSANIDNADREQLGIDINHILQGEVPVEILVEKGAEKSDQVKLRADLTNAEISFDSIAWRKPRGRAAVLHADLVRGKTYKLELQNLRIEGEDIAMQGMAGISGDNRLREIDLKELALSVVSKLQINAVLKTDANDKTGTWQVKVKGRTFDGKDLFRSLLSVSTPAEKQPSKPGRPAPGLDLEAEVDNVLGHNDISIRNLRLKLTRRNEKLATIEARGTLDGGAPIAVTMVPAAPGSPRLLRADTADAGQAFRLVGFYPNMQSGRGRIEVNVDGRGPAEKTGILWVDEFRILNDTVASELLKAPAGQGAPSNAARTSVAIGDVLEFERMKVPFSVGHGQFVVENAYLRGPAQGIVLTGKADFKLKTINMGGTFIPLHGLNNALGDVPLFGELLSNGVFGLTFAVQGSLAQPQVLVNPFSMVAPGILRELTQMTNPNPQVIPRDDKAPTAPVEKRTRAAPPAAAPVSPRRTDEPVRPKAVPQTGAGWASQVAPSIAPVPPAPQPAKRPVKKPPAPAAAAEPGSAIQ